MCACFTQSFLVARLQHSPRLSANKANVFNFAIVITCPVTRTSGQRLINNLTVRTLVILSFMHSFTHVYMVNEMNFIFFLLPKYMS